MGKVGNPQISTDMKLNTYLSPVARCFSDGAYIIGQAPNDGATGHGQVLDLRDNRLGAFDALGLAFQQAERKDRSRSSWWAVDIRMRCFG